MSCDSTKKVYLAQIHSMYKNIVDTLVSIHDLFQERFPPNIYYKIYTHRSVQDICANAPRDYTKADAKRQMARDVHNKTANNIIQRI